MILCYCVILKNFVKGMENGKDRKGFVNNALDANS